MKLSDFEKRRAASHRVPESPSSVSTLGGTGLTYEDLRVDSAGKVALSIGTVEMPRRVDTDSSCAPGPANKNC